MQNQSVAQQITVNGHIFMVKSLSMQDMYIKPKYPDTNRINYLLSPPYLCFTRVFRYNGIWNIRNIHFNCRFLHDSNLLCMNIAIDKSEPLLFIIDRLDTWYSHNSTHNSLLCLCLLILICHWILLSKYILLQITFLNSLKPSDAYMRR